MDSATEVSMALRGGWFNHIVRYHYAMKKNKLRLYLSAQAYRSQQYTSMINKLEAGGMAQ